MIRKNLNLFGLSLGLLSALSLSAFAQVPSTMHFSLQGNTPATRFGESMAATDDSVRYFGPSANDQRIAIGSPGQAVGAFMNAGAVFLAELNGAVGAVGQVQPPLAQFAGTGASEFYGSAVATVKNFNGSSKDILAIGAPGYRVGMQLAGKVDFKDAYQSGVGNFSVVGTLGVGNFGKSVSQPPGAVWDPLLTGRGNEPEVLISSPIEKRVYFINLSNGYAGATTSKHASHLTSNPLGLATPSSAFFGSSVSTIDLIGDARQDLVVCDSRASFGGALNGAAFIYDGADIVSYLSGATASLYPSAHLVPDTSILKQYALSNMLFCNSSAVVTHTSIGEVLFVGSPSATDITNMQNGVLGAVVAYRRDPVSGQIVTVGTKFGESVGINFGYSLAVSKRSHLVVGAPRAGTFTSPSFLASVKYFDVSYAGIPSGFVAAMSNPLLTEVQSTPAGGNEDWVGRFVVSARNKPGEASPVVAASAIISGAPQLAKSFSNASMGFVSVTGNAGCQVPSASSPVSLSVIRDPANGNLSVSVQNIGGGIPFVALYDPDLVTGSISASIPGLFGAGCTAPYFTFPYFSAITLGGPLLLPTSALDGFRAYVIGIVFDPVSGQLFTSNAVVVNSDLRAY